MGLAVLAVLAVVDGAACVLRRAKAAYAKGGRVRTCWHVLG
jgi:hypothetical protein